MIQPQNYTFENFPEATDSPAGMKVLNTSRDDWFLVYEHDVPYVERDGILLHLQILKPVYADWERRIKAPCIVFIQGSAWMKQNIYLNLANLAKIAQRGFVVAAVEYRPSDVASFPAQVVDSKTAVRFMRKNAAQYHVDPDNVFVFGDSSGGHTSLMVGITAGMRELDSQDDEQYSAHVNAVVDFYGPTDISRMNDVPSTMDHIAPDSPEGRLIGRKNVLENLEEAQKTNPINYISREREIAPILMMHGSKDELVPFHQSVLIYEALRAAGKEVEFYKLKEAQHGGPQFWTCEVLDIVEEFLRKHIRS